MDRDILIRELRVGLAETRRYLLSHHKPTEYDRCHKIQISTHTVHLCARCSGIYPGIGLGFGVGIYDLIGGVLTAVLIGFLPAFALIDWIRTSGHDCSGSNIVRTLTGLILGIAYGLGLSQLLFAGDLRVVLIGIVYIGITAVLLRSRHSSVRTYN